MAKLEWLSQIVPILTLKCLSWNIQMNKKTEIFGHGKSRYQELLKFHETEMQHYPFSFFPIKKTICKIENENLPVQQLLYLSLKIMKNNWIYTKLTDTSRRFCIPSSIYLAWNLLTANQVIPLKAFEFNCRSAVCVITKSCSVGNFPVVQ